MILVYLLQVLNGIVTSLWVALVLSAIWGIACGIYALVQFDEITYTKRYVENEKRREELLTKHQNEQKKGWLMVKQSILAFCILGFLLVLTPNKKQAIEIVAVGSAIEYARNNEKIQQLPDKLVDCLDKYLTDIAE